MRQSRKVRAFKNQLRNYNDYVKWIDELQEKIDDMWYKVGGVKGVDPSKEPLHSPPNTEYYYMMTDKIADLEEQKNLLEANRDYVDRILTTIEIPLREAIMSVYCDGKTISSVSLKYHLSSSGLNKRIIVALKKALN